jgi:hypothetical protein
MNSCFVPIADYCVANANDSTWIDTCQSSYSRLNARPAPDLLQYLVQSFLGFNKMLSKELKFSLPLVIKIFRKRLKDFGFFIIFFNVGFPKCYTKSFEQYRIALTYLVFRDV